MINGTNSNHGGFCVSGMVQHIDGNHYRVVANYELNDYVDPDLYALDWIYMIGSKLLLGPCIDYELKITGRI